MKNDRPLFILAGNGPYENHGCEAITRGTVQILRDHFKEPRFVCISHFNNEQQYQKQKLNETDNEINHIAANNVNKHEVIQKAFKPSTWAHVYQHYFNPNSLNNYIYENMFPYLDEATAVLSVGGDNYSIDFGLPVRFTGLDDIVLKNKKSIVLWGSSVGPFTALPEYEQYMTKHLNNVTGIFARESMTVDYLKKINICKNVYHVADPAFCMDPIKPTDDNIFFERGAIGINLSPLLAKYITNGNLDQWTKRAGSIIQEVAKKTEMPVYLIPHVTITNSNDYKFMQNALSTLYECPENVTLVHPFCAAEIKWVISQMTVFAGARTHSTIAALSSCVPTLSFAYSMKASGINMDIFGDESYVVAPQELDAATTAKKISDMVSDATNIKNKLVRKIPEIKNRAGCAGEYLKNLLS